MASAQTLLLKLDPHDQFTADEQRRLLDVPMQLAEVGVGFVLVREGDRPTRSCLVVNGLVCASKLTGDGNRQILSFYISGDIPDLQSLHLTVMDVTFETMTPATLAFIPHQAKKSAMNLLGLIARCGTARSSMPRFTESG